MRFRNYINWYNRRNRIYSYEDLLKMTLASLFDNEASILAQNSIIGIPSYDELALSPNTEWIEPYKNEYGLDDGGYWQSILQPEYQASYASNPLKLQNDKNILPEYNEWDDVDTTDLDEYLDKNIIDMLPEKKRQEYENENNDVKILEGRIEKNGNIFDDISEKVKSEVDEVKTNIEDTKKKYEGLRPITAAQKAASKILPYNDIENEYYRNSLKMKDGEPLTEKFLEENDVYTLQDITDPENPIITKNN